MTVKFETLKEWFLKLDSTYNINTRFQTGTGYYNKDKHYLDLEITRYRSIKTDKRNSLYLRYWEGSDELSITYNEDLYDNDRDTYESFINDDDVLNLNGITTYENFINKINKFCQDSHDRWTQH